MNSRNEASKRQTLRIARRRAMTSHNDKQNNIEQSNYQGPCTRCSCCSTTSVVIEFWTVLHLASESPFRLTNNSLKIGKLENCILKSIKKQNHPLSAGDMLARSSMRLPLHVSEVCIYFGATSRGRARISEARRVCPHQRPGPGHCGKHCGGVCEGAHGQRARKNQQVLRRHRPHHPRAPPCHPGGGALAAGDGLLGCWTRSC